ncbi:CWF19-like protein 1 homolog [Episyrphus balteatus]|uniref:CWF19-like protein 1 homolog n=1 Tax=Episyrphus balteatus TaxID=286459 RepID=UPI0024863744|nr:CWF19-like protein 1 homolog [Episyrphus balteatus]
MDQKIKILVSGDVNGNFKQLFTRVESINKKAGPFDLLLCCGEFFSPTNNDELIAYKNGFKNIPVPTYILGPNTEETAKFYEDIEENGDICTNLTFLGKRGLYTLSSGVKIAYLSGFQGSGANTFNKDDVMAVRNSCLVNKTTATDYKGVDILITSQWPHGIAGQENNTSKLISYLSKEIKPRYHFCGINGIYEEPKPYRIPADSTTQFELCTRFIALANVGNPTKQKAVYALSLCPVEKMRVMDLIQKTTTETACPFVGMNFDDCKGKQQMDDGKQYFYDLNSNSNDNRKRGRKGFGYDGQEKRQKPTFDQEKCWFCLSSPDVEKHLVISVGDSFYLALAKGPINDYHVLILSITHIQSAALLADSDWAELIKFKEAIREFFKEQGQTVCFTERNYKCSHLQINALGIDEGYAWKIKHGFEDKAEEYNITFDSLPEIKEPSELPQRGPYFVAELPDRTTLLTQNMKQFPIHFAREVFCSENLLNCDEKTDWKDCSLTKDEEIELVKQFREKYKKFDFTL